MVISERTALHTVTVPLEIFSLSLPFSFLCIFAQSPLCLLCFFLSASEKTVGLTLLGKLSRKRSELVTESVVVTRGPVRKRDITRMKGGRRLSSKRVFLLGLKKYSILYPSKI